MALHRLLAENTGCQVTLSRSFFGGAASSVRYFGPRLSPMKLGFAVLFMGLARADLAVCPGEGARYEEKRNEKDKQYQ